MNLVADVFVDQTGDDLADALRHLHDDVQPDAIAYLGYGYPVAMFNPILRELDWDPPRIMSTAFMWYINEPSMLDDMEGWYGVDQVGNDRDDSQPELLADSCTDSKSGSVAACSTPCSGARTTRPAPRSPAWRTRRCSIRPAWSRVSRHSR